MSEKDPYRIFVTHVYGEHEEYSRVFEYLESRDNFFYVNCSDPENRPAGGNQEAIKEALRKQIKPAEIVIFPVGVHAANPNLIDFQLKVAQAFDKPIVAIKSFGGTHAIPRDAMEAASEVIDWNDRTITEAIKRLGRGMDAGQLDVIEFDLDGIEGISNDDIIKGDD